jgi:effector-binding domain-containing protein
VPRGFHRRSPGVVRFWHALVMSERDVDVVEGPRVETRAQLPTLGIREVVPFRTMLANRDRLLAELVAWVAEHDADLTGPFFLRLHVVDMTGAMDIEVGVIGTAPRTDGRVSSSLLPAGRYAVLDYRNTSLPANRLLHKWIREHGLATDSHDSPNGEAFAARCEIYLTDPRTERKKTRWVVQLAFLLSPTNSKEA